MFAGFNTFGDDKMSTNCDQGFQSLHRPVCFWCADIGHEMAIHLDHIHWYARQHQQIVFIHGDIVHRDHHVAAGDLFQLFKT